MKNQWPWQHTNLQSPDPKSGALSIRPTHLNLCLDKFQYPLHLGAKIIEYIFIKDTQIDIQSFLSFHMGSA